MSARVLVLGSDTAASRCISAALASDPSIECVIGGHRVGALCAYAEEIGAEVRAINLSDQASLRQALDGIFAVVNTLPAHTLGGYEVAGQCARTAVHYIDLAGNPAHVAGITAFRRKAESAACLLVSGATAVPAVSGVLVDLLAQEFERLKAIHIAILPADDGRSWLDTVRAVAPRAGQPLRVKQENLWRDSYFWSEPGEVLFPAPFGRRRVYLCDVPDLRLFPSRYAAETVTFRVGLQSAFANRVLSAMARFRHRKHSADPAHQSVEADPRDGLQRLLDRTAAVHVRVQGLCDGLETTRMACLVNRSGLAPVISCSPAIALIKHWVRRGVSGAGAVPCLGLLNLEALKAGLLEHDIVLVRS
ncbi:MAG: saccharopine dehydrogenase family protein [Acidiferrobacterales bacterium]